MNSLFMYFGRILHLLIFLPLYAFYRKFLLCFPPLKFHSLVNTKNENYQIFFSPGGLCLNAQEMRLVNTGNKKRSILWIANVPVWLLSQ